MGFARGRGADGVACVVRDGEEMRERGHEYVEACVNTSCELLGGVETGYRLLLGKLEQ